MSRLLLFCLGLLAGLAAGPATAATSQVFTSPRMTARLLTDTDRIRPGQSFRIGLALTPAPGWHTYWSNPGDAGAPPDFHATDPALTLGPIAFPPPTRLADGPEVSFVYAAPVLLARQAIYRGALPAHLAIHASWLVCKDLCIPEQADFTLDLAAGAPAPAASAPLFAAATASLPIPAPWPATIAPDGTLRLGVVGLPRPLLFFPDAPDTTDLAALPPVREEAGATFLALMPTPAFQPAAAMTGVLESGSGAARRAYRITARPGPAGSARAARPATGFFAALLLAFAGGLILNLMPCVFPIFAIKALGLAALGGQARARVRLDALAALAGVLASVTGIALILLVVRSFGAAAGWGFQFQRPGFVLAMGWLFFALGLNLSGLLEIGFGFAGAGQALAGRGGVAGSFFTGLLAVLVATPCTAPFMGAALAASATAPAPQALAIFLALGLGFGLPWLVLALRPGLAALLPRPGSWMQSLREFLAFPLYAAALWLGWVLVRQTGSAAVLAAGGGMLLIALAAWGARRRPTARLGVGLLALVGLVGLSRLTGPLLPASAASAPPGAQPFSEARLARLRAGGQPVLVDISAAWCISCLVNERVAIDPALPALTRAGVTFLVGDWTRPDPAITAFLHAYGRVGVPLYVYFARGLPPTAPGRVLPQLLTPALVRSLS